MLKIEDVWVDSDEREALKGGGLGIPQGETYVFFGKNGSGKSTLLMTVMGSARYRVKQGRSLFRGREITHAPIFERARMGLGIAFRRPPTIRGVKIRDVLAACSTEGRSYEDLVEQSEFAPFLDREVNHGLSGGELKRSELLQLLVQDPSMVLPNEPDSGVDLENLQVVGEIIGRLLQTHRRCQKREKSGLIISHTGFILDYVHADRGYILIDGWIYCFGHPLELLSDIGKFGYEECARCQR